MGFILLAIVVALVCAVAGAYAIYRRDLSNARARVVGRSSTIDTSVGVLEYAVVGEGEPVLVCHGAGGGFDQAIDMAGALAERGFSLIAPSRFGYLGSTSRVAVTTAAQADAYAELLDRLHVHEACVIAISAGAWSAVQFAIRHPERCRALVLVIPANYLPAQMQNYGGAIVRASLRSDVAVWAAAKLTRLVPGVMSRAMLGTNPDLLRVAEPGEKKRVRAILLNLLPMSARSEGMKFDIRTAAIPEAILLHKISCPVLAVSAEDDLFGTAARARHVVANVANGRIVIYPTGGHALVGRQSDLLNEVASFISANRSTASAAGQPSHDG